MWHFFFSGGRRHTGLVSDWSSDVCSSDLGSLSGGTGGSSTIEKSKLVPAGACQARPSRPRPSVCSPAAAAAPPGAGSEGRRVGEEGWTRAAPGPFTNDLEQEDRHWTQATW